jgi:hypothetical protein
MRLLATSWAMPGMLSFLYFVLEGELCHSFIIAFLSKISPIRGNISYGLCCRPWQSAIHSSTMRLLITLWATPVTLGWFYFALGVAWATKKATH